ncbi:MAG: DUF2303 family protein [Alphaproteobacteria bacterium]|jgi:hypothetical protein|nr:DUF2303 family protein [Alphaproteobacteria bacterium]
MNQNDTAAAGAEGVSGLFAASAPLILGEGTTALIETIEKRMQPAIVNLHDPNGQVAPISALALPQGLTLQPLRNLLDPFRLHPERRQGTARLDTVASLIDFANRFKNEHSALYALPDRKAPTLTAVINYHRAGADGQAEYGDHRGHYAFPLSDEWQAWTANDGEPMEQAAFAAFLEDRITDVVHPPALILARQSGQDLGAAAPQASEAERIADQKLMELLGQLGTTVATASKLLELSRGMAVHSTGQVKNIVNLQSGAAQVVFSEEHLGSDGAPLVVPGLFLVGIPVFLHGRPYRIPVRLRYRKSGAKLVWFYQIHRPDLVFDDAFREAAELAGEKTGLPLFYGQPETVPTAAQTR